MDSDWTIDDAAAGTRLDKYLAAPERLGSRARAVAALERGKVYLNNHEASLADAGVRLAARDTVRVWMDRPGSARVRRPGVREIGDVEIVFEDEALIVVNKPAGLLTVPLERKSDAPSVYDYIERHLTTRPDEGS